MEEMKGMPTVGKTTHQTYLVTFLPTAGKKTVNLKAVKEDEMDGLEVTGMERHQFLVFSLIPALHFHLVTLH